MKSSYRQCGTFGSDQDGKRDYHHLLWPRHDWSSGAAYLLRNDRYFGLIIPKCTIHRQIHRTIMSIPVPTLDVCHDAEERLYYARKKGTIDPLHDTPEKRLDFLIHLWENPAPATAAALERELLLFEEYEIRRRSKETSSALVPDLALA